MAVDQSLPADLPARSRSHWPRTASLATALVAFLVYAFTAARTITWWDGSSYPLAACTLGITAPPGSLLLTLLGWAATRIAVVRPVAFQLNLLAGLIAASLAGLVTWLAIHLATPAERAPGAREAFAGAVAGLSLASSLTVWTYATQFTPYILTAFFTAAILAVALEWWRRVGASDARAWLFPLFLLFGLDFSVHRTNALLLPAALVWVALRRPRAWTRPGTWAAAIAGLALGLAFHLLLIPMSAREPAIDIGQPRDLARFWSYVSLEQQGGGFLFHVLPRKAAFVRVQLADYAGFLRGNVAGSGPWLLALLPAGLALLGWRVALRGHPRRTLGLLGFFLCGSLGAVLYFNLPAHYFRSVARHYLPSLVVLAPLVGVGAAALLGATSRLPGPVRGVVTGGLGALLLLAPIEAWRANHRACDLSRTRFAETFSRDVLEPLPERAILFTNGDNDTFPLWYLQAVEGVRRDVTVVNLPLANLGGYVRQLRRRDPDLARLLEGEDVTGTLGVVAVGESTVTIPVARRADHGLPSGAAVPESVNLRVTTEEQGGYLLGQDRVVLDLLRRNAFRRPVYLAVTVAPGNLPWLRPYARLDALAFRLVPSSDPAVRDLEPLRRRLLEQVSYAGVADTTIVMDSNTRALCGNYVAALMDLAGTQLDRGDAGGCLETLGFLERRVPPERLGMDPAALWSSLGALRGRAEAAARGTGATTGSAP